MALNWAVLSWLGVGGGQVQFSVLGQLRGKAKAYRLGWWWPRWAGILDRDSLLAAMDCFTQRLEDRVNFSNRVSKFSQCYPSNWVSQHLLGIHCMPGPVAERVSHPRGSHWLKRWMWAIGSTTWPVPFPAWVPLAPTSLPSGWAQGLCSLPVLLFLEVSQDWWGFSKGSILRDLGNVSEY